MKTERIVLSFIAVLIGVIVAGIGFYFYQSTKTISPQKLKSITLSPQSSPTPTPLPPIYLTLDAPTDEGVVDTQTITVAGKTVPNAIVLISTKSTDDVITPSATGAFTTTETIDTGVNTIEITAIAPDGEESKTTRTVTYSTETF